LGVRRTHIDIAGVFGLAALLPPRLPPAPFLTHGRARYGFLAATAIKHSNSFLIVAVTSVSPLA
jgi:hypothetical protein